MTRVEEKQLKNDIQTTYTRALEYLNTWFDFDGSPFKSFKLLALHGNSPPTYDDCIKVAEMFPITIDKDALYDEIGILNMVFQEQRPAAETSVDLVKQWCLFFQKSDSPNLYKIISSVLCVPVSNAYCERIFSLMGTHWRDDRNCLLLEMVKAELCIRSNMRFTCSEFYKYLKDNEKLLKAVQSRNKYKFIKT